MGRSRRNVIVTFAGTSQEATAGKDRAWIVVFPAMEASSEPHQIIVKGAAETLSLDNALVGDDGLGVLPEGTSPANVNLRKITQERGSPPPSERGTGFHRGKQVAAIFGRQPLRAIHNLPCP